MSASWIKRIVGIVLLVAVLSSLGHQTTAIAQAPSDSYQSGADPIAPELPSRDRDDSETANAAQNSGAADKPNGDKELDKMLEMDLKDLSRVAAKSGSASMDMEVSTVSRTESSVGKSPAAVYVITNEMIRRSGARNIPEALRLAPGVNVARITTDSWAISIRGFNDRYSNKLLVQIDGRAVYTPGFGGVWWDMQQVLLDDVERIEIVRGPGGTVWGANAVNGVINIVTKEAAGTQGLYAQSGGGSEHRSFNAVRAGGRQGDLHWRTYGLQADDAPGYTTAPGGAWDPLQFGQGGFRTDWTPSRWDTLTLQGDFYGGQSWIRQPLWGSPIPLPPVLSTDSCDGRTTNFLGRWTRKLDDETDWSVQMYYNNWNRVVAAPAYQFLNENTFDLDCQYHTKLGERHDVVCGFGYRNYDTHLDYGRCIYGFVPTDESLDIISYFVQDTVELRPDRLFLTAGIKLEHNDFTNFEYQPSIRLLLTPDEKTSIWGAISRAVRTPTIVDRDVIGVGGLIRGSRDTISEDLIAYELGMRRQATEKFYWDLATFFNRYDNLIALDPLFFPLPYPAVVANVGSGDTYGFELVGTYDVHPDWQLRGIYTFFVEDISYGPTGRPFTTFAGRTPRNQFDLISGWNLSCHTKLDMIWRYVDCLEGGVPRYFVMDVRLAWESGNGLEIAVVGQNLLDNHHPEFLDAPTRPGVTEVQSGVYGMVTWRY